MILACDPSTKRLAFAWRNLRGEILTRILSLKGEHPVRKAFAATRSFLRSINTSLLFTGDPVRRLIIEDQYLHISPSTYARLVEVRTAVELAAHEERWEVCRVNPARWKSRVLGYSGRGAGRLVSKKLAVCIAEAELGKRVTEDEADAVCLLFYGEKSEWEGAEN